MPTSLITTTGPYRIPSKAGCVQQTANISEILGEAAEDQSHSGTETEEDWDGLDGMDLNGSSDPCVCLMR